MQNEVADVLGVDVIIPVSSVKPGLLSVGPEGLSVTSPAVFGVREMSRPLEFSSSYTLVEHAPAESIEQEIIPRAQAKIQALKQAWSERNHAAIVEMIGAKYSFDRQDDGGEEELRAIEALLLADGSGEITRHPYVHQQLDKLLARWAFKVTTGGGFELPAFALADDGYLFVANGFLYTAADWLPKDTAITTVPSTHGLCVRYPIRMFEDLLPVRHLHPEEVAGLLSQKQQVEPDVAEQIVRQQICLADTYILHSQTAKENGGDFDFDYVCVVDSDRFPRFVSARFNLTQRTAGVIKDKQKKAKSPWFNKEFVALKMRGNRIGSISDLKTRCYAAGRSDLAYLLVAELQKELDSLKHGVRADSAVLAEIREKVPPCPWLSLKNIENVSQLPSALDVLPTDQVGHLYNALRKEIEEMFEPAMDLSAFRGLMAGTNPTREMFDEVLVLNSTYAALHASLAEKRRAAEAMVAKAEKALESAGKKEDAKRKAEQKLAQARAHLKQALESSKDQAGTMAKIVCAWAQGKTRDREAWAEALHQTVSRGKGMGSILFHAFPQELVSATAQRTGGVCTKVQTKKVVGYVAIDDLAFFQCNGNGRRFLFRYDDKKRAIVLS